MQIVPQKTRMRLFQAASSHFLQIEVDDYWEDLSEEEQDRFLEAHAWKQPERYPAEDLREFIDRVYQDLFDAYVQGYIAAKGDPEAEAEEEQAGGREPVSMYDHLSTAYCEAIKK